MVRLATHRGQMRLFSKPSIRIKCTLMKIRLGVLFLMVFAIVSFSNAAFGAVTNTVTLKDFSFTPKTVTIQVGDTIRWVNSQGTHNVTGTGNTEATCGGGNNIAVGNSCSKTFTHAGTFNYRCAVGSHAQLGMTGTITVQGPPNVLPSVTITNPVNNAVFVAPASFIVEASATDGDGTISQVQFLVDGSPVGTDPTGPLYSAQVVGLPAGAHVLRAIATDNAGGKATNQISVTSANPPVVTIDSPTNNTSFEAPVTLSLRASATSSGSVTQVVFVVNSADFATINGAGPYEALLSVTNAGDVVISAKAFDSLGLSGSSPDVTVHVTTAQPPVRPLITAPQIVNGSILRFLVSPTKPGSIYRVEANAALTNRLGWQTLLTTNVTGDSFQFEDNGLPLQAERFYRVQSP
jgi:plastocyanin